MIDWEKELTGLREYAIAAIGFGLFLFCAAVGLGMGFIMIAFISRLLPQ